MNNTYIVHKSSIVDLLNQIELFQDRMDNFNEKNGSRYLYSFKIYKQKDSNPKLYTAEVHVSDVGSTEELIEKWYE